MEAWLTAAKMNDIPTLTRLAPIYLNSTSNNQTALMTAAQFGSTEAVEFLLPELSILDNSSRSALFYATSPRIANLLIAALPIRDASGTTAAHYFAQMQNAPICRVFYEFSTLCDSVGRTPLHVAAQIGNFEICEIFSEAIGQKDDQGTTALVLAVVGGFVEICQFLASEVDEMSLRYACLSDVEILRFLAGRVERVGEIGLETRQIVFERIGGEEWKVEIEGDGEVEVEGVGNAEDRGNAGGDDEVMDKEFEELRSKIMRNQEKLDQDDVNEFKVNFE